MSDLQILFKKVVLKNQLHRKTHVLESFSSKLASLTEHLDIFMHQLPNC